MTARNKLKAFTDKLKTVKHIELILLLAAICIGVLVFLAVGEREEKSQTPVFSATQGESEEERLEYLLESIDGVGDCSVMITYGEDEKAEGVVVAASGAGDMKIKLNIIEVVRTLLDVDGGKIKVYKTN